MDISLSSILLEGIKTDLSLRTKLKYIPQKTVVAMMYWLKPLGSLRVYNWSMDNGYSKELSIDRINHNGNYEPSNCRWATPKEQNDNKRCNILITINGTTLDLQQWCDKIGIKRSTVNTRVRMCGWTYEKALSTPVRKHKEYKVR